MIHPAKEDIREGETQGIEPEGFHNPGWAGRAVSEEKSTCCKGDDDGEEDVEENERNEGDFGEAEECADHGWSLWLLYWRGLYDLRRTMRVGNLRSFKYVVSSGMLIFWS